MNNVVPLMPNTLSLDEHVTLISETWKQTSSDYVDGVIKTGQRVIAAQLEHGEALRAVADKLPFHWRTAGKLTEIAKWSVPPGAHEKLPAAWTILYELSRVPEKIMLEALRGGRIHPNMKRSEAIALKPNKPKRKKLKTKVKHKQSIHAALTVDELKSCIIASLKRMKHGKRLDTMSDIAKDLMRQFPDMDIQVYGNISTIKIGG